MIRPILTLALIATPLAAFAAPQQQTETGHPPQRIRNVTLIGDQKCPKATGDEVVVCSHIDAGEQYRIPERFRGETAKARPANKSWITRGKVVDDVNREQGQLPGTCSPVGPGGAVGCTTQVLMNGTAGR